MAKLAHRVVVVEMAHHLALQNQAEEMVVQEEVVLVVHLVELVGKKILQELEGVVEVVVAVEPLVVEVVVVVLPVNLMYKDIILPAEVLEVEVVVPDQMVPVLLDQMEHKESLEHLPTVKQEHPEIQELILQEKLELRELNLT